MRVGAPDQSLATEPKELLPEQSRPTYGEAAVLSKSPGAYDDFITRYSCWEANERGEPVTTTSPTSARRAALANQFFATSQAVGSDGSFSLSH